MPSPGKESAHRGERVHRLARRLMVLLHIEVHHLIDIECFHAAGNRRSHGVADEIPHVRVAHNMGIGAEDLTLLGVLNVHFDCCQSAFPRHREEVVEHFERIEVFLL